MKVVIKDSNGFSLTFEAPPQFDRVVGSQVGLDKLEAALQQAFAPGMEQHLTLLALLAHYVHSNPQVVTFGAASIEFHLSATLGSVLSQLGA